MTYKQSPAENRFHDLLMEQGIPQHSIRREWCFALPEYKFRFDFFLPWIDTAIEVEGGVFHRGRHVRPSGYMKDCTKYNEAVRRGYFVLRTTSNKQQMKEVAALAAELYHAKKVFPMC